MKLMTLTTKSMLEGLERVKSSPVTYGGQHSAYILISRESFSELCDIVEELILRSTTV